MAQYDAHRRCLSFDPVEGYISLPGSVARFTIRRDPESGLYLSLGNSNVDPQAPGQLSVLSLISSQDLIHRRHVRSLLEDDSGLSHLGSLEQIGFQCVDWQFDGVDLVYLGRTAYDGAHNCHDANRITFHRLESYGARLNSVSGPI